MVIHDFEQYTDSWWRIREGIPTASKAADLITAKTGVLSVSSKAYMSTLIAEHLGLGDRKDEFQSFWMERGSEMEKEARRFFTFETGLEVREVGFITNDDGTAGASPDSLVLYQGNDEEYPMAGLEIKCPKPSTHISYLINGGLPDIYKQQVHFSMAITGLDWFWMSYHPELDPVVVKVEPDEYTAKVSKVIDQFIIAQCEAMQKMGIK